MHAIAPLAEFTGENPPIAQVRAQSPTGPGTAVLLADFGPSVDAKAKRLAQVRAERLAVSERTLVQAIDRWLDGAAWDGHRWTFGNFRVRLEEEGDALTLDGVTIVSRAPIHLHDLKPGTRTGVRLEARALAAVAVRGDAGWYDGKPRKVRDGVFCVWDGRQYVMGH